MMILWITHEHAHKHTHTTRAAAAQRDKSLEGEELSDDAIGDQDAIDAPYIDVLPKLLIGDLYWLAAGERGDGTTEGELIGCNTCMCVHTLHDATHTQHNQCFVCIIHSVQATTSSTGHSHVLHHMITI